MLYTIKYRNVQVICSDVDKSSARAICQLLYFLIDQGKIDMDLNSIEVESVEEVRHKKHLLEFIQD